MIDPPVKLIGLGGVIVETTAVPLTQVIGAVGAMVAALAIVGAAELVAIGPVNVQPKVLCLALVAPLPLPIAMILLTVAPPACTFAPTTVLLPPLVTSDPEEEPPKKLSEDVAFSPAFCPQLTLRLPVPK